MIILVFIALFAQAGILRAQETNSNVALPGFPPIGKSPTEDFRRWLTMSPGDLETALEAKSPAQRESLRAKLAQYAALPIEEREARLQLLELRWYLRPLMEHGSTNRTAELAALPDHIRPLVLERLKQWDRLKPEVRSEVLESEGAISSFVRLRFDAFSKKRIGLDTAPDPKWKKVETLPTEQGQKMAERLDQYFSLTPREKEKTLKTFSDEERAEMQRTLDAFEKLSMQQRRVCVASFTKFASMPPEGRRQFLKNAERWQTLTPEDRAAWRDLVNALPPIPFETEASPAPMPPR